MELKSYFTQDNFGNIIQGATVYVYQPGTQTLVTGLTSAAGSPIANPTTSDFQGSVQFRAPNGIYDVKITSGAKTYTMSVQFNDVSDTLDDIAAEVDRAGAFSINALASVGETQIRLIQTQQAVLEAAEEVDSARAFSIDALASVGETQLLMLQAQQAVIDAPLAAQAALGPTLALIAGEVDRAEAAADAARLYAGVYASTTVALATVPVDQYFSVPAGAGISGGMRLYRNQSGAAVAVSSSASLADMAAITDGFLVYLGSEISGFTPTEIDLGLNIVEGYNSTTGKTYSQTRAETFTASLQGKPALALASVRALLSTKNAQIGYIGDSITESHPAGNYDGRIVNTLQSRLRRRYGQTNGGLGFVTLYATDYTGWPVQFTGTNMTWNDAFGPKLRCTPLVAGTDHVYTLTAKCTTVKIMYRALSAGVGLNTFEYRIDGGSWVTLDTYQAFNESGKFFTVAMGASSSHTLAIRPKVGTCYIEGLLVQDGDEAGGIGVYELGVAGRTAQTFATGTGPNYGQPIVNLGIDLLVIQLGVNDWWGANRTPDQIKTDLSTIITTVRSRGFTGPTVLSMVWEVGTPASPVTNPAPWFSVVDAARQIADADDKVLLLDISAVMPRISGDVQGYYVDATHPNKFGADRAARAVYELLTGEQ